MVSYVRARFWLIGQSGLAGILAVLFLESALVGWKRSSLRKLLEPSASLRRDMITYCLDVTGILRAAHDVEGIRRHTSAPRMTADGEKPGGLTWVSERTCCSMLGTLLA